MFDALINAIITIAEVAIRLIEFIVDLVFWIVKILTEAIKILNPVFIVNEIIAGVYVGIQTILKAIGDIFTVPRFPKSKPCDRAGEGLFGFRRNDSNAKKKCIKPTMLRLLFTMLCPPLGLFLHLGFSGWFHVLFCTFLTIKLYYFPGFLYAIMHIIC
tara:strand:- start:500 stop:973 length:474 start_codon:yes stop_codon:yes gene_type:complete